MNDKKEPNPILIKNKNNTIALQNDLYLLGNGDNLELQIIGMPELNSNFNILNDGNSTIPLVGITSISGMSINEAKLHLEKLLSKELINPKINLILVKARPIKISLLERLQDGIYNFQWIQMICPH